MKIFKKFLSSAIALTTLFSVNSVFANGILPEDEEAICDAMEKITEDRSCGYCQFIYSSSIGESLLKESLKYALDIGRLDLAKRLIKVFGELHIDINEVDGLDAMVIKTGRKDLYEDLVKAGYKVAALDDCEAMNNLLEAAIESENVDFVEEILKGGFDPNAAGIYELSLYPPLHSCLVRIGGISDDGNGHGFEYLDNRVKVKKLVKIVKLLCDYGANPYLGAGKSGEETAFDLLEELNPENENNCYGKLEFYSKKAKCFCHGIYKTLKGYIYNSECVRNQEAGGSVGVCEIAER